MANNYQIEEIKKQIRFQLDECETIYNALCNVERVTKKDGTDFSILSKNFKNAMVQDNGYSLVCSKSLYVSGRSSETGHYFCTNISIHDLVKDTKFKDIDQSRIIKTSGLEPYFFNTVDEIFQKIEQKKEYYKKNIDSHKKELEKVDEAIKQIDMEFELIRQTLKDIATECNGTTLKYALCEYIKKNVYF